MRVTAIDFWIKRRVWIVGSSGINTSFLQRSRTNRLAYFQTEGDRSGRQNKTAHRWPAFVSIQNNGLGTIESCGGRGALCESQQMEKHVSASEKVLVSDETSTPLENVCLGFDDSHFPVTFHLLSHCDGTKVAHWCLFFDSSRPGGSVGQTGLLTFKLTPRVSTETLTCWHLNHAVDVVGETVNLQLFIFSLVHLSCLFD